GMLANPAKRRNACAPSLLRLSRYVRISSCDTGGNETSTKSAQGVEGAVEADLGDGVRRAQRLSEQADPQFLDHPADLADLVGLAPVHRQRREQVVVLGLHRLDH